MEIKIAETPRDVALAMAEYMVWWSREGSLRHIALSGGSTPKILFELLAREYRDRLPWEHLHFYWGDERCVPPGNAESNYGMTQELLLGPLGIAPEQVHRIRGEATPSEEASRYADLLRRELPQQAGFPRFDLVLLGMGADGHTASVFPHQAGLWDSDRLCEVATHPESGQKRITLTGDIINAAARVAFLVTGSSKAGPVAEIVSRSEQAKNYPAARVHPKGGELIWMLDRDAASGL